MIAIWFKALTSLAKIGKTTITSPVSTFFNSSLLLIYSFIVKTISIMQQKFHGENIENSNPLLVIVL